MGFTLDHKSMIMEKVVSVDCLQGIMEKEIRNSMRRRDPSRPMFRLPTYRGRSIFRAVLPLAVPLFVVMILLLVVVVGQDGVDPLDLVADNLNIPQDTYAQVELNRIVEGSLPDVPSSPELDRVLDLLTVHTYAITTGDTLSSIGATFGVTPETIASYNGISLYGNLQVGETIEVPSVNGRVYTVQSGDSLSVIGQRFGVSVQDVIDANDLTSTTIYVGQKLFLPNIYVAG